jgi:translin
MRTRWTSVSTQKPDIGGNPAPATGRSPARLPDEFTRISTLLTSQRLSGISGYYFRSSPARGGHSFSATQRQFAARATPGVYQSPNRDVNVAIRSNIRVLAGIRCVVTTHVTARSRMEECAVGSGVDDQRPAPAVAEIVESIIGRFGATHQVRNEAGNAGRPLLRMAANTIRALHRGDEAEADRLSAGAEHLRAQMAAATLPYPAVYWAGYVQDAMKEYAEARLTAAMLRNQPLPGPDDLGVEDAAWLNGAAEAASELRRDVLDLLRKGQMDRAEALLGAMDEIYDSLISVDFPDAITGGLRRTTDQLRAVLERTRGDVTLSVRQDRLERALSAEERRITRPASPAPPPD